MPTTKKPLKRYSILDRCFSNTGRNYTFEGLKEAVNEWMLDKDPQSKGISTRQLRDDISFHAQFRRMGGAHSNCAR